FESPPANRIFLSAVKSFVSESERNTSQYFCSFESIEAIGSFSHYCPIGLILKQFAKLETRNREVIRYKNGRVWHTSA
ncbi:MAG TPA: hypothetical protein VN843_28520, partial [Anaerolineales bacterium]|nr:hypothetical protein [Anaerolineales bacterium]